MNKALLSIDWDYFIPIKREWCGSYFESKKNIQALWYKRYFKAMEKGENIVKGTVPGNILDGFWSRARKVFNISKKVKIYITDSHKWSYYIAKENNCNMVFNIDAHSDLGYEGLESAAFEVNCANWLGKLISQNIIEKAFIVYSPYTYEKKDDFKEFNDRFDIKYGEFVDIKAPINIEEIHICRSGMWTPPWLDSEFYAFSKENQGMYLIKHCPSREWKGKNITLAEKIDYLYCS